MRYLLETNIVSEITKRLPDAGVLVWFEEAQETTLFLSVITIGEIRKGIDLLRRRQAPEEGRIARLEQALEALRRDYHGRIMPISEEVAEEWGRMCAVYPNHPVDNLLSATAKVHDMTLVTRNLRDVEIHGIACRRTSGDMPPLVPVRI